MNSKTKKLVAIAMLCAIAYVMVAVGRIPVVMFLKYDPKDIIITLGGFIWGPSTVCIVSLIVSLFEWLTLSENGIWGFIMNVVSTCSFGVTAALIYKKKRTLTGAVVGLVSGWIAMIAVMLLWNYWITPIYMHVPRSAVAEMLIPTFLPFNALKGGLNACLTFLLYRPLTAALRKTGYIPHEGLKRKNPVFLWVVCGFILVCCVMLFLALRGILKF